VTTSIDLTWDKFNCVDMDFACIYALPPRLLRDTLVLEFWGLVLRTTEFAAIAFPPLAFDGRNQSVFVNGWSRIEFKDPHTPETGELLAKLEAPHAANISFLRFSLDGARLFALEWDQQVQVWDLLRIQEELHKLNLDWTLPPGQDSATSAEKRGMRTP
jgi:hypothetical protein